jgi:hypothetical protein
MSHRENAPHVASDPLELLKNPEKVFKNPQQLEFMRELINVIQAMNRNLVHHDRAAPHIILVSPDGISYNVSVDDLGVLQTVASRSVTP